MTLMNIALHHLQRYLDEEKKRMTRQGKDKTSGVGDGDRV